MQFIKTIYKLDYNELEALKILKHPNIIELEKYEIEDNKIILYFPYIEKSLEDIIYKEKKYNTAKIMRELFEALNYCHSYNIAHFDIKPDNILYTDTIKLIDFGFAYNINNIPPYINEIVSQPYRPPDIICGEKTFTTAVDIWSAGCIYLELILGNLPFRRCSTMGSMIYKICQYIGGPTIEYPLYKDFLTEKNMNSKYIEENIILKKILCWSYKDRPTAEQILKMMEVHM